MYVFIHVLFALLFVSAASAAEPEFRHIEGSGGAPIAMMEWGNTDGPGILFLHGMGFSSEFWLPQAQDPSLDDFHMAAIDLRGHGASAKPWRLEETNPTHIWAEDVAAAVGAAGLRRPVIVGWSYGGYVAMDYIRHFGVDNISGLVLIGSPAGLVDRLHPAPVEGYEMASKQRLSLSVRENTLGNRFVAKLMSATQLPDAVTEDWAGQLNRVPVYFMQALQKGRSLENRDIQERLTLPVAIAVGEKDLSMPFEALETLAAELPRGQYWMFETAGHAVSYDAAAGFNARLARFVSQATE